MFELQLEPARVRDGFRGIRSTSRRQNARLMFCARRRKCFRKAFASNGVVSRVRPIDVKLGQNVLEKKKFFTHKMGQFLQRKCGAMFSIGPIV